MREEELAARMEELNRRQAALATVREEELAARMNAAPVREGRWRRGSSLYYQVSTTVLVQAWKPLLWRSATDGGKLGWKANEQCWEPRWKHSWRLTRQSWRPMLQRWQRSVWRLMVVQLLVQ